MNFAIELILSLLLLLGGSLILIGSLGLIRLPDVYTRLHAPTKATTLGMGAILIASMLFTLFDQGSLSVQQLLITLFLFISAPLTGHLLAKTAMHQRLKLIDKTKNADLIEVARDRKAPNHSSD
jgi:multicomponent K+:H+ antiporter subunit G